MMNPLIYRWVGATIILATIILATIITTTTISLAATTTMSWPP